MKPEVTFVNYKTGYQIVDGKKIPLTKEQEEGGQKILRKSLEDKP